MQSGKHQASSRNAAMVRRVCDSNLLPSLLGVTHSRNREAQGSVKWVIMGEKCEAVSGCGEGPASGCVLKA